MGQQQAVPQQQPVASHGSSFSFAQGFVLGQFSIALLIFFFIKFFIFGEPPSADDRALHLSSLRRARTLAHQASFQNRARSSSISASSAHNPLRQKDSHSVIRAAAGSGRSPSISQILAKTYYNVKGHQPESLDWFNVLIAQTIAQLREDARQDGAVLTSLTELLNSGSKPDWIGEIRVTEIALGDEFPIFSNCRVMPAEEGFAIGGAGAGAGSSGGGMAEEGTRLQARMDVDLSDVITLGVETTLVLNYPKPRTAVLPVALAVSVIRFSGTLAVSFIPSSSPPSSSSYTSSASGSTQGHQSQPPNQTKSHIPNHGRSTGAQPPSSSSTPQPPPHPHRPTTLAFTFLDDYRLDLSVRSLVGSRSRLQDVPKIAQLIESRLHAWFDERAVEPRFQQIALPSLWPRKRNTRGGEEEQEGEEEGDKAEKMGERDRRERRASMANPLSSSDQGPTITTTAPTPRSTAAAAASLEARLEAEGAKICEAEIKAGERRKVARESSRENYSGSSSRDASGMRWRGEREGDHHQRMGRPPFPSTNSWEGSGQRGMPGAMPGG